MSCDTCCCREETTFVMPDLPLLRISFVFPLCNRLMFFFFLFFSLFILFFSLFILFFIFFWFWETVLQVWHEEMFPPIPLFSILNMRVIIYLKLYSLTWFTAFLE